MVLTRRLDTNRIGDSAKNAFHSNPENTVFDAKRLIGRKMDEPEIKRDIKHWPFKVIEKHGKPSVQVQYKGTTHDFVRSLCGFPRACGLFVLTVYASFALRPPRRSPLWF